MVSICQRILLMCLQNPLKQHIDHTLKYFFGLHRNILMVINFLLTKSLFPLFYIITLVITYEGVLPQIYFFASYFKTYKIIILIFFGQRIIPFIEIIQFQKIWFCEPEAPPLTTHRVLYTVVCKEVLFQSQRLCREGFHCMLKTALKKDYLYLNANLYLFGKVILYVLDEAGFSVSTVDFPPVCRT